MRITIKRVYMKLFRTISLLLMMVVVSVSVASGQGYLMLAGGAGESWGGWSDAPYGWVVEHAANKKVAVISYDANQTEWIPNYFMSLGAVVADNIHIGSRFAADQQSMYDSLTGYDAIFLKGGNQFNYYDYYRDTKTSEAFQLIYDNGGVLAGTSAGAAILSPIVFTAEVASVDAGQALLNAYTGQVTLEDDFLETFSGRLICDTHFAERGRFGRLPVFMANWYRVEGEVATGVGIDDHTALCIDPEGLASVYGQGAVTFLFSRRPENPFDTQAKMLVSGPMEMRQLLNGCTVDLNSWVIQGLENEVVPPLLQENRRNTILFTGTDYPSDTVFSYFVAQTGHPYDAIVIVTGLSTSRAEGMKGSLEAAGAGEVTIVQALSGSQGKLSVTEAFEGARKFLFIENNYNDLLSFAGGWGNGPLLMERLTASGVVSLFIGDNARFAGKTVVENYRSLDYPSYHGELIFSEGLGLLGTSAIMPYAFVYSELYENTVTGLPYAMVKDSLSYGLYVTGNTLGEYSYDTNNQGFFRNVTGSYPLVVLHSEGTVTGFADQGPDVLSRNVAGFGSMALQFLGPGDRVVTGRDVPAGKRLATARQELVLYPNPATEFFRAGGVVEGCFISLSDLTGREVRSVFSGAGGRTDVSGLPKGVYLVRITDPASGMSFPAQRLIILTPGD